MSDLIKQVGGIEKAREIVEGAPDWANGYNTVIQQYVRGVWFSRDFRLNDLRTAIAEHDTDHVTDIRNHVSPSTKVVDL